MRRSKKVVGMRNEGKSMADADADEWALSALSQALPDPEFTNKTEGPFVNINFTTVQ